MTSPGQSVSGEDVLALSGTWEISWWQLANGNAKEINPKTQVGFLNWELTFKPNGWQFDGFTPADMGGKHPFTGEIHAWSPAPGSGPGATTLITMHVRMTTPTVVFQYTFCGRYDKTSSNPRYLGFYLGQNGGQARFMLARKAP